MLPIKFITDVLFIPEPIFYLESPKNDYRFTTESIADFATSADKEFNNCSLKTEEEIEWLTTEEASEYLRLSAGSFRNMVSDGHIPHYKLGKRNRYLRCELRNLLSGEARGRMYNDKIR